MLFAVLFLIIGFVLLVKGADWLVEGASALAKRFGISDLAIGLTIVAFGTSAPELVVNIVASAQGASDIAIGNVVGSNIANILLILGISAMITPVIVQRSTVRKEIPFSLLAAVLLFVMANDALVDGLSYSALSRSDGLALLGFFVIFLAYTAGLQLESSKGLEDGKKPISPTIAFAMVILGFGGLVAGGKLTVDSAVTIARSLGLSEALIGLTVVAIGTSLPELATSAVAAFKKKVDIAVGNIVGSNIFNIFLVLGVSATIRPLPFSPASNADLMMVIIATVLLFIAIHNGWAAKRIFLWWKQYDQYIIRRWEGALLLTTYGAYIVYIAWRG
ncbi:sodium:proton exchanger [Candidatus Peregrinibacteria bacterium CG1_02_54_53]|nr:MAG: sodium:proton exchanger [Candidatus Peregrinibacteria bacterium CG1_02_54_53]